MSPMSKQLDGCSVLLLCARHLTRPRVSFTKWDYKVGQIIGINGASSQRHSIKF